MSSVADEKMSGVDVLAGVEERKRPVSDFLAGGEGEVPNGGGEVASAKKARCEDVDGQTSLGNPDTTATTTRPQKDSEESSSTTTAGGSDDSVMSSGGGIKPDGGKDEGEVHKPPVKVPQNPAELEQAIRKQIEYYFSDHNMKFDAFFHNKISENPESWLNVQHILSCRNIRRLNVTSADAVLEALKESHLETKKDENGMSWVRRTTPLPVLEKGGRRNDQQKKGKGPKLVDMSTVHNAGCLSKAVGCPEEASWEAVKTALAAKLPEGARVRFVSQMQQSGTCYIYTFQFENDKQFFTDSVNLDINGAEVVVSLLTDAEEATKVVKSILPPSVSQQRDKILNKGKAKQPKGEKGINKKNRGPPRPIILNGTEFQSINHLRNCIRELLSKTSKGTVLGKDTAAYKVISSVLNYHPRAEAKQQGMVGIKVDEVTKGPNTAKCFFIMREGGDGEQVNSEDFSVLKCLSELEKNPPFKESVEGEEDKTNNGDASTTNDNAQDDVTSDVPKENAQN